MSGISIHGRVAAFHFARNLASGSNLNQVTGSDAWAGFPFSLPRFAILNQFRPIRIQPALSRLHGMNAATSFGEEMALLATRLAKSANVPVANDVFVLERGDGHVQESSSTLDII